MSENKDKKFIKNILKYKKIYDEIKEKLNNYKIISIKDYNIILKDLKTNKKNKYLFYLIGYIDDKKFIYFDKGIRELILDHIKKYNFVKKNMVSKNFIKKYFEVDEIKIKNIDDIYIIIYLISICNVSFNVIEIIINDKKYFGLIQTSIQSDINYDYDKYEMYVEK